MDKMYVCEWSGIDLSFNELEILNTFDYTYHYNIEQSQLLASMKLDGYIISKSLVKEDCENLGIPKNIECLTIWIYELSEVKGKYDYYNEHWYYTPKHDGWLEEWKDMLSLPVPLKYF